LVLYTISQLIYKLVCIVDNLFFIVFPVLPNLWILLFHNGLLGDILLLLIMVKKKIKLLY